MSNPSKIPPFFRTSLVSIVAALMAASAVVAAHPAGRGPHGRPAGSPGAEVAPAGEGRFLERMFDRLDLDEAQRERMEAIAAEHRTEIRAAREQLRERRRALAELAHAETLDEAAIRAAGVELGAAEAETALLRGRHLERVRTVLTPEQWAEFERMREQRRERAKDRRHDGRRHRHHGGHRRF